MTDLCPKCRFKPDAGGHCWCWYSQPDTSKSDAISGLRARLVSALARAEAAERELTRIKAKRFPVLSGGMTVPWQMLAPHEPQARDNHSQSLQRLAERGGLSWAEMLCVLEGRGWGHDRELTDEAAKPRVLALVAAYEAGLLKPVEPR